MNYGTLHHSATKGNYFTCDSIFGLICLQRD